jgi:ribosomal protein S18 acetylase RimI-like enzyme
MRAQAARMNHHGTRLIEQAHIPSLIQIVSLILGLMFTTRIAEAGDAALITTHRRGMFAEIGLGSVDALDTMSEHFRPWVERMVASGKYVGWIVEDAGQPVASAGFFELEWPPHPHDPAGNARGYLLNFWVEPSHRRKGLARELVKLAIAESRRRGFKVTTLHASNAGRPVYESLGFRRTSEMWLVEADRS